MHRPGHYGTSLLVYSPIGFVLVAIGAVEVALIGGVVVVTGAMVPDWDTRVPFIRHRGPTHTVWFALIAGIVLGGAGGVVGSTAGIAGAAVFGAVGFLVGVAIVVGHLLADALTPMGIRPFEPIRDDRYTLDLAKAANPIANYALLALGVVVAVLAFIGGELVAGALGV